MSKPTKVKYYVKQITFEDCLRYPQLDKTPVECPFRKKAKIVARLQLYLGITMFIFWSGPLISEKMSTSSPDSDPPPPSDGVNETNVSPSIPVPSLTSFELKGHPLIFGVINCSLGLLLWISANYGCIGYIRVWLLFSYYEIISSVYKSAKELILAFPIVAEHRELVSNYVFLMVLLFVGVLVQGFCVDIVLKLGMELNRVEDLRQKEMTRFHAAVNVNAKSRFYDEYKHVKVVKGKK